MILIVVIFQLSLFLRFGGLVLVFVHLYRLFDLVGLMILKVSLNLGTRKLSRTEADFHERLYPDFILHIAIIRNVASVLIEIRRLSESFVLLILFLFIKKLYASCLSTLGSLPPFD